METINKVVAALFGNGSVRRWGIGLIAMGVIAANGKFALGLTIEMLGMITSIAIALILGSNFKEAKEIEVEGQIAVEEAKTGGTLPVLAPKTPAEAAGVVAGVR